MRISQREAQLTNEGPWNNTDQSKQPDSGNPNQTKIPRHVVQLQIDPKRNQKDLGKFVNWESLNLTLTTNPNTEAVSGKESENAID